MLRIAKGFHKVIAAIDRFNGLMRWPVILLLMALTSLVIYEVIMRYIFNHPTMFSNEVSQMIQVAFAMLGAGYVLKRGGHVHVEIIFDTLNSRWRGYVGFIVSILGVFYCAVLAWLGWLLLKSSFSMVDRTLDLAAPLWPIKAVFFLGICLFGLQFIVNSYNYCNKRKDENLES